RRRGPPRRLCLRELRLQSAGHRARRACRSTPNLAARAALPSGAEMARSTQIAVERLGSGPVLLLLHGGAGPELTWDRQRELAERWSLIIPTRRGFPRSAPAPRQDFEADGGTVRAPLTKRTPLVGCSYGGVGVTLAAQAMPQRVRSLTLIEAPLYGAAPDDPGVRQIAAAGDAFLSGEADELTEREFLADAGLDPEVASGRTAPLVQEAVDAARGGGPPAAGALAERGASRLRRDCGLGYSGHGGLGRAPPRARNALRRARRAAGRAARGSERRGPRRPAGTGLQRDAGELPQRIGRNCSIS